MFYTPSGFKVYPLFDVKKIPTSLATITHVLIIHSINDVFMFFTHQGRECQ